MDIDPHNTIKNSKTYAPLAGALCCFILIGCGGGGDGNPPAGGGGPSACSTTGTAAGTYAISWDNLPDPNNTISGYKIYFSSNATITKQNAEGSFNVTGMANNNNYLFSPATYNMQACATYYFAVATLTANADES